jgi:hypothetical protein
MNATLLYRIAAVVLILFAAGHTFGVLRFKPPTNEAQAVRNVMDSVRFTVRGADVSFGDFYTGFGLAVSVYLLFTAFLSWHLGNLARAHPAALGALGWAFVALQAAIVVISWRYFSLAPALLAAVVTLCLAAATWRASASPK